MTPVRVLNSSAAKWALLPPPAEAYMTSNGRALAKATSSLTEVTGNDGCTTSTLGTCATSDTGAKSASGANGSLGFFAALATKAFDATRRV